MSRWISCVVLLSSLIFPGCASLVSSRNEQRLGEGRVLEARARYHAEQHTLSGRTLIVNLGRSCSGVEEVESATYQVDTYTYSTGWYWMIASAGIASGIAAMTIDSGGEAVTSGGIMLGAGLVGAGALTYAEVRDPYEVETVTYRETVQVQSDEVVCADPWPYGRGVLHSPGAGVSFDATVSDLGRAEIDLQSAPARFWESGSVSLELPGISEWVSFQLSEDIRTAGLDRAGSAPVAVALTFSDSDGDNDGMLDPNEIGYLFIDVTNHSTTAYYGVVLQLSVDNRSVDLDDRIDLGDLSPGAHIGTQLHLEAAGDLAAAAVVVDTELIGVSNDVRRRLTIPVDAPDQIVRAYSWFDLDSESPDVATAGIVRLEAALTGEGAYRFVSDSDTRAQIDEVVERGGGSAEERFQSAVLAANQANITRIFRLSIQAISSGTSQVTLSVYDTSGGDMILQRYRMVDGGAPGDLLDTIDRLAHDYLAWTAER